MEPTEAFNIRWDDFEANTRVALKELLDDNEFCDVTLVCDGKQVSAHKVILAGGSKFFQQVLKQNPHPHPLIYLKGVRYEYLLSILDFVYTGEANINQEELHSFLDVAKDLQIKRLTEKNPPRKASTKEGDTIPGTFSHQDQHSAAKKEASSHGNNQGSQYTCEGGNIKLELDDTMMDFKTEVLNSYETGSIFKKGPMTPDWQMRYDGDENHNDQDFSTMKKARKVCSVSNLKKHTKMHAGEKPYQCLVCFKRFTQSGSLKEHTRIHTGEKPFQCMVCLKRFTQTGTLSRHKKRCSMEIGK